MAKRTIKQGLSNPAVLAAASSPAGQKAVGDVSSIARTNAETTGKIAVAVVPFIVKVVIIGGIIYVGYRMYSKRFIKLAYNPSLDAANISDGQAQAKADAIYAALFGVGADFAMVAAQLAGLNYNGWVKLYNAYGQRMGANLLADKMNLVEWLNDDQFSDDEMSQLRFILPGVF